MPEQVRILTCTDLIRLGCEQRGEKYIPTADDLRDQSVEEKILTDPNDPTGFVNCTESIPTKMCPYCNGRGCKPCHSTGKVPKILYDTAPEELKK